MLRFLLALRVRALNYGDIIECRSNFSVYWRNPVVRPFKLNLFGNTSAPYHLFFNILQDEI